MYTVVAIQPLEVQVENTVHDCSITYTVQVYLMFKTSHGSFAKHQCLIFQKLIVMPVKLFKFDKFSSNLDKQLEDIQVFFYQNIFLMCNFLTSVEIYSSTGCKKGALNNALSSRQELICTLSQAELLPSTLTAQTGAPQDRTRSAVYTWRATVVR